jgi:hypothetical protein
MTGLDLLQCPSLVAAWNVIIVSVPVSLRVSSHSVTHPRVAKKSK